MAANVSLFPMLNEILLNKIRFQASPYSIYYIRDEEEYSLSAEEMDGATKLYKIVDTNGIWSPDEYNLCIRRKYSLRTYQCLFGKNGIACKNAVLGLAIVWTSADSKQRGVLPICELKNSIEDTEFMLEHDFSVAQLRGIVEFTTVIYIKEAGTPAWEESHLANEYGCLLGELDRYAIKLDGIGSIFPMYEVNAPGQPLWYIKCNWEDPRFDKFEECIEVYLNKAHKNYKYIDKTKRTYDDQLLKEIMASALCTIIIKLKEEKTYWDTVANDEDTDNGSICEAVSYFLNTLEWDASSLEKLSLSIRKFLDQRM